MRCRSTMGRPTPSCPASSSTSCPTWRRRLAEAVRVDPARAASVAAYLWDYAGRMELIRRFWDAAIAAGPGRRRARRGPPVPARRRPIASRSPGRTPASSDVLIMAIDVPTRFADFDDFWQPFTVDIGPAPGYACRLSPERREALRERLRATLPTGPEGTIDLIARAWAVRGRA